MTDHKPKIEIDPSLLDEAVHAVKEPKKHGSEDTSGLAEKMNAEVQETDSKEDSSENFKDRWIRVSADFDNFRKRIQKDKADLIKYGNENLIRELLPVMDNFERALATEPTPGNESLYKGIELIYSQLRNVLERFGVTTESAKGKIFDPNLHEAMSHVESKDFQPQTVVDEHQRMYFLHKKLIRPALVTVAKDDGSREAPTVELSFEKEE